VEIERQQHAPKRQGISMPARVAIGALAIFGALSLVQWVISAVVGTIKFALVVVVVVAVAGWIIGAKGSR
jgi:hypothetical protein